MAFQESVQVLGTLVGDKELRRNLRKAPGTYRAHVLSALTKERDMWIGKPAREGGKSGVFRRKLERKRLWGDRVTARTGGTTWSRQISSQFKGYIEAPPGGTAMTLRMGVMPRHPKRIHYALQFLGWGGTITGSMLIIPVPRNIRRIITARTGAVLKTGNAGKLLSFYSKRPARDGAESSIVPIRSANGTRFYDRDMLNEGRALSALLFIGVRSVHIKRQFNFGRDWKRRLPKVLRRIDKRVDKATRIVQEGKARG